ncbi:MAG TPA: methyltransferase [Acidimicrobiales bacterium]|jgi:hypothetical protein|nr:methyltransferase [Acidimicrobiales bacterium]
MDLTPTDAVRDEMRLTGAAIELRSLLQKERYAQLYRHVAYDGLFAPDRDAARRVVATFAARERCMLELFALGVPSIPPGCDRDLSLVIEALISAGMVTSAATDARVSTSGWVVVPALNGLVATGLPPLYDARDGIGAAAYIGDDSLMLARALGRVAGRRVLDLGCGCGVQGVLAATGASEAVLTDVDEVSVRFSRFNAALNGATHPISVKVGDLFEPVAGERFDDIVVLPPYLPSVPGSATTLTVDGGPDGLVFIRRLLGGVASHLEPDGQFLAICQLLCDDDGPILLRELETLCPELEVRMSVTNWHPTQPYALELARKLADHGADEELGTLLDRYLSSLRALGVTGACTADIRARHSASAHPRRQLVGRAPVLRPVDVLCLRDDAVLPRDNAGALLVSGSATGVVDCATLDLLRALDGRATIDEAARSAWGAAFLPERAGDLVDQAIERILPFETSGLVGKVRTS